jgi:putative transposase
VEADSSQYKLLSPKEQELAQKRYRLLQPFLEQGVSLSRLAEEQKVSIRTLRRWIDCYRQGGLFGLIRQSRSDKGVRRAVNPQVQSCIEGLCLRKPPPSVAFVYRTVVDICKHEDLPVPSYSAVYDIVRKIDPALITLAHEGTKAYKEAFDLIYRREAKAANQIWQADHTQLDCWLLDSNKKARKPWLTVILDDYSRAVAGYFLSFEAPSALRTALALRQAIWRKEDPRWHVYGIPDQFYTDHGSDFTSLHMEQVSIDLKFELIFSTVGQPRGRGKMERFFGTVNQLFLPGIPGHAPNGTKDVQAKLTLDDLDQAFRTWLLNDYLSRPHGETKAAPQERWEANGFIPRVPETFEQLDLLLLTVAKTRRVHQDGIHFQGFRYMNINLAGFVGEYVMLRYDPRDLGEIIVYTNNNFLCRAVCAELADQTVSLKSLVKARNEQRKELRSAITNRSAIVDRFLGVHQPKEAPDVVLAKTVATKGAKKLKRYEND